MRARAAEPRLDQSPSHAERVRGLAEYVLNNRRLLCIKHWQHVKTDKGKAIAGLMADMSIKVKRANTQASNNGYFQVERWAIRDAPQTATNTTEERQQKVPKAW
mgnify:CR=1 FL=1